MFVMPQGVPMLVSFKLSFECINNNVDYEALLLGLKLAIEMKYEFLKIYGDSLLIVNQVKDIHACNQLCIKLYKAMVKILLEHFKAYDIEVIPKSSNRFIDTIASL